MYFRTLYKFQPLILGYGVEISRLWERIDNSVLTEKTTRLFDCDEVTAHLKIAGTLLTYGDFIDYEESRQVIPFNS